ncbi:MAG: hypothetical protein WC789_00505 [Lentisphaeria bacterium]|jgi:hypothetical protein
MKSQLQFLCLGLAIALAPTLAQAQKAKPVDAGLAAEQAKLAAATTENAMPFTIVTVKGDVRLFQKDPQTGQLQEVPVKVGMAIAGSELKPEQPVPTLVGESQFKNLLARKTAGSAKIRKGDQGEFEELVQGQIYPIAATLRTSGRKAMAELELAPENTVTLLGKCEVRTVRDPEFPRLLTFALAHGELAFRLDNFPKFHRFQVNTRLASYVAVGTSGSVRSGMTGRGAITETLTVNQGGVLVRGNFLHSAAPLTPGQGLNLIYDFDRQLLTVTFTGQAGEAARALILGQDFKLSLPPGAAAKPVVVALKLQLPLLPEVPPVVPQIPTKAFPPPPLPPTIPEVPQSPAGI